MKKKINKLIGNLKKGFTLVELIIVIAIIAVLSVSAMMLLTKWLSKSRDSRRLSDIQTIRKALDVWLVDLDNTTWKLPEPTNWTGVRMTGSDGSAQLWIQWTFGETVISKLDSIQKVPSDPSTQAEYTYSVTPSYKKYQILAQLERQQAYLINWVYAENKYSKLDWNFQDWIYIYQLTGSWAPTYGAYYIPSIVVYSWVTQMWESCNLQYFAINGKPYTQKEYNELLWTSKCIWKVWTWNDTSTIQNDITKIVANLSWMTTSSVDENYVRGLLSAGGVQIANSSTNSNTPTDNDNDWLTSDIDCDDNNANIWKAADGTCDGDNDGWIDWTAFNGNYSGVQWDVDDNDSSETYSANVCDIFGDSSALALYELDLNWNDSCKNYNWTVFWNLQYWSWKLWNAGDFDGIDDFIQTSWLLTSMWSEFTISLWWYNREWADYRWAIGEHWDTSLWKWWITIQYVSWWGKWGFWYWHWDDRTHNGSFDSAVVYNKWQNIVVTYSKSANKYKVYVDGSKIVDQPLEWDIVEQDHNLWIWKSFNANDRYFKWKIDQVRVFKKPLTEDEIKRLYYETHP